MLEAPLGRGATATVWRARRADGVVAALKVPHLEALLRSPEAAARLRREVDLAHAVQHPGVVRPLAWGDSAGGDDGVPWVAFELVVGARTLDVALARATRPDRVRLLRDVALAVAAAHGPGVVHRDLKPANILVDEAGQVRVTDFGLGWAAGVDPLTRPGVAVGTPAYMAPEVVLDGARAATHPRVDVWALGVMLFEALTDRHPLAARGYRPPAPGEPAPRPRDVAPDVPDALDRLCARALETSPAARLADAGELARGLDEWLASAAPVSDSSTSGGPGPARAASGRLGRVTRVGSAATARTIGPYTLLGLLGKGGMGEVHRASDSTGREVALKLLLDAPTEKTLARFRREAEAAARVRHPNLVGVHAAGVEEGRPFIAFELVQGESLDKRLGRGPLEPAEAVDLVRKLAGAAGALHAAGIVHRDIKPANIIIGDDGEPRLADLGIALLASEARLTATGDAVGSPLYMAPEQHEPNAEVDARMDVWALGAVLVEALAGVPPFSGRTVLELMASKVSPRLPSALRRGLPAALDHVAARCLATVKDDRYPGAAELADDLASFLRSGRVAAAGRGRSLRLLVALALAAALLPFAALGARGLSQRRAAEARAARLDEARRGLEAAIASTDSLAQVDVAAAAAALADGGGDAGLEAWLAVLAWARGEPLPAGAGPPRGRAELALEAAHLAADGDAGGALEAVRLTRGPDFAGDALARAVAGELARRGPPTDPAPILEGLARLRAAGASLGEEGERLEAMVELARGRGEQAASRLARLPREALDAPGRSVLQWQAALDAVAAAIAAKDPDGAARALEGTTPAPGPVWGRAERLAAAVLALASAGFEQLRIERPISGPQVVECREALRAHVRLLPGRTPPAEVREALRLGLSNKLQNEVRLDLGVAAANAFPDDAELWVVAAQLQASNDSEWAALEPVARRALERATPAQRPHVRVGLARCVLGQHRWAEGLEVALAVEADLDVVRGAVDPERVAEVEGEAWTLQARARRWLGQTDEAIAVASRAAEVLRGCGRADEPFLELVPLLVSAGRAPEAFERGVKLFDDGLAGSKRRPLAVLLWEVGAPRGEWPPLRRIFLEHLKERGSGLLETRRALLHADLGDGLAAAAALRRDPSGLAGRRGPAFVQQLERLEPEAIAILRAEVVPAR